MAAVARSQTGSNIASSFATARGDLEKWSDLPPGSGTIGGDTKSSASVAGQDSPQSNWGVHHTKSNISVANVTYTPPAAASPSILDDFKTAVDTEGQAFKTAFDQTKTDVIDRITSLSAAQVANKIIAILGDLLLNTVENLLDLAIDILATLVEGIIDLVDAPINVPIISPLYSLVTEGSQLSVLDLICLVVAIPVTLIYKIAVEKTSSPTTHTPPPLSTRLTSQPSKPSSPQPPTPARSVGWLQPKTSPTMP